MPTPARLAISLIAALAAAASAAAQPRAPSARIPAAERAALVALYTSTNGPAWKSAEDWVQPDGTPSPAGTECDWEGIDCDDDDRHVVSISLADNRLAGPLPRDFARLDRLETLDLANNALTGEIPPALLLPRLKQLRLGGNAFAGTVPAPATQCALVDVDVSHNALGGAIPPALSRCGRLELLDLRGNRLSSAIPREIGLLRELKFLMLGGNALTGALPPEVAALPDLKGLDLSDNQLSGFPPSGLFGLVSVEYLNISSNRFTGPLPDLRSLANLKQLIASGNAFSGALDPARLPVGLTVLDVARNQLRGELQQEFAALEHLTTLDLTGNGFAGPLPDLARMRSLVSVRASGNRFSGDVGALEAPDDLRELDVSRNDLQGVLAESLFAPRMLRQVLLSQNRISGLLPASLWQSKSLEVLDASDNAFEGALPQSIQELGNLRVLKLARNRLSGTPGAELLGLPRLAWIDLSGNQLTGELPREPGARGLQGIDLSQNRLTGTIPEWVSSLPALSFLGLGGNRFTGGLDALARSTSLRAAVLDANPWEGGVPPRLTSLPSSLDLAFPLLDARLFEEEEEERPAPPPPPPPAELPDGPQDPEVQATIAGVAKDQTGTLIPGATITLSSPTLTRIEVTGNDGFFRFIVPPGTYTLTGTLAGFQHLTRLVTAHVGQAARADLTFEVGGFEEVVELAAGPPEIRRGPWWNTWTTARGAKEDAASPGALEPNRPHTFYLELSALERALSGVGIRSDSIDNAFRDRLEEMLRDGVIEPRLTFRFMVVGRGAALLESPDNVEVWTNAQWTSTSQGGSTATAAMRLTAVIGEAAAGRSATDAVPAAIAARAGGLRFGIMTRNPGCAAVAISIWDEALNMPLDSAVHVLQVGTGHRCPSPPPRAQAAIGLLRARDKDEDPPEVWLHVFEFPLPGSSKSASFMLLREPPEPAQNLAANEVPPRCPSYAWPSDATLSRNVLENDVFARALVDARRNAERPGYAAVARSLVNAVFPRAQGGRCGSDAAWKALQALARKKPVTMYARLTDRFGQVQAVPLGLLAMAQDTRGRPLLPHDLRVIEPLPRETLSPTECVSAWTFVLPPKLKGVTEPVPPLPWEEENGRVLRTRMQFETEFVNETDTDDPLGLVLLAHHRRGFLTFEDDTDRLDYTEFTRKIGDGSIAVLSACETASLIDNAALIARLNQNGVDALVTSPFVIDPAFGIAFAVNFATVIHQLKTETTVADAFDTALTTTVQEFVHSTDAHRARGLGLELVLAGNPRLKICPREDQ